MTSLAQIDLHTQLATSAEPQIRSANEGRSTGESRGGFAETLQRRTNADDTPKRSGDPSETSDELRPTRLGKPLAKDNHEPDKPVRPSQENALDAGDSNNLAKPDTDTSGSTQGDSLPAVALPLLVGFPTPAPLPDQALPTEATELTLPILAVATPVAAIAAGPQSTSVVNPDAGADELLAGLTTAPNTNATPANAPTAALHPTATAGTSPQMPMSGEAITAVVASTPASTVTAATTPVVAAGDTRAPVAAISTPNAAPTDVPVDAALPPVTASDSAAQVALTPAGPANTADVRTETAVTAAPPTAQALHTATPATQSAAMHAVATSIGMKEKTPAEESLSSNASTGKLVSEVSTTLAAPITSTPVITQTRPLSDAVLAQATLSANGNAMEKVVSNQVTKALVQNLPNGDKMMVLRLTPPELGTVKIEVIERQGVLSARLHAEDDGVRLALERFLPSMRQDLRAHDAPIRELTLSDQAQFQRSFAGDQPSQQHDTNRSGNRREREDTPRFSVDGIRSDPVALPRSAPLGGRVGVSGVDARA